MSHNMNDVRSYRPTTASATREFLEEISTGDEVCIRDRERRTATARATVEELEITAVIFGVTVMVATRHRDRNGDLGPWRPNRDAQVTWHQPALDLDSAS
jgi:hypothetical protein